MARDDVPLLAYALASPLVLVCALGVQAPGAWTFLPPLVLFGALPLLELVVGERRERLSDEALLARARRRDFAALPYALGAMHLGVLGLFLWRMAADDPTTLERVGAAVALGCSCGVFGINLAHEVGHRSTRAGKLFARVLLWTTFYPHFVVEHVRGHHVNVATEGDPASARADEGLYRFLARAFPSTLRSALAIGAAEARRDGRAPYGFGNETVLLWAVQVTLALLVLATLGPVVLLGWIGAGAVGALLLETVNFVEHWGLSRARLQDGTYEPFGPQHAWNSDHLLGRLFLLELPRHSDHHLHAARPYGALRSVDDAPRLPFGYPAMMVIATVPPLWRAVMEPRRRAALAGG